MSNISFKGLVVLGGDTPNSFFFEPYHRKFSKEKQYQPATLRITAFPEQKKRDLLVVGRDATILNDFLKENLAKIQVDQKFERSLAYLCRDRGIETRRRKLFAEALLKVIPTTQELPNQQAVKSFLSSLNKPMDSFLTIDILKKALAAVLTGV